MLTSVIVPTYNGAKYISLTLDGVLAQTESDWELLVVDDGSGDGTPDIVRRHADADSRIRLFHQAVGNVAAARNLGLANISTTAQFVMFLDHDDVLEPDALSQLKAGLLRHPQMTAAHGLARYIDDHGDIIRPGEAEAWTRNRQCATSDGLIAWPLDRPTTFDVEVVANYIFTPGQALVRRSALDRIGPLDAETAPADDYDLWLRLCALGDMVFVDRVVLNFRQHSTNQSRRARMMTTKERLVRRKLLQLPTITTEQRNIARLGWRLWYTQLAHGRLKWARQSLADRAIGSAARNLAQAVQSYVFARYGTR